MHLEVGQIFTTARHVSQAIDDRAQTFFIYYPFTYLRYLYYIHTYNIHTYNIVCHISFL